MSAFPLSNGLPPCVMWPITRGLPSPVASLERLSMRLVTGAILSSLIAGGLSCTSSTPAATPGLAQRHEPGLWAFTRGELVALSRGGRLGLRSQAPEADRP